MGATLMDMLAKVRKEHEEATTGRSQVQGAITVNDEGKQITIKLDVAGADAHTESTVTIDGGYMVRP